MANQIWGISDKNAGHIAQLEAVLSALPIKNKIFTLENKFLGKFACSLLPLGVSKENLKTIQENLICKPDNLPNLLIVVGRRNLSIALFLKKHLKIIKPDIKLIFLMPPGTIYNKNIDYLFIHRYKMKQGVNYPSNVIPIDFPPSRINFSLSTQTQNTDLIKYLETKCNIKFNNVKRPYIGVLIGGKAKGIVWNKKVATLLCKSIDNLLKINKGSLFVVNSRRTGSKIYKYIRDTLTQDSYFFDFNNTYNPYIDIVTKSEILIVTGESTSMIADCITLNPNAKILIFDDASFKGKRFKPFREFLYQKGFAVSLNKGEINVETLPQQIKLTNSAYFIADFINSLYN